MNQLLRTQALSRLKKALEGFEVYVVGGFVRDFLLHRPSKDIDLVVVGRPEDFTRAAHILAKTTGSKPKYSQFNTATLRFQAYRVDLSLARTETYPEPGALPVVREAKSIEDDLARRDFAANAVALGFDGRVVDPFDGIGDVHARILRILHRDSFKDDPTRAFRCVRYQNQLDFSIHPYTEARFQDAVRYMANVSFERIRTELIRISGLEPHARARAWVQICQRGLIPGLLLSEDTAERLASLTDQWICFYALARGKPMPGMTKQERKTLITVQKHLRTRFEDIGQVHQLLRNAPEPSLMALAALDPVVRHYIEHRHLAKPLITPETLQEMGFTGQEIGQVLLEIEKARLSGLVKSLEDEMEYALKRRTGQD